MDSFPILDRQDLDRVFASQYVQTGTFGAEAQGIENSVKGVGWVSEIYFRYLITNATIFFLWVRISTRARFRYKVVLHTISTLGMKAPLACF